MSNKFTITLSVVGRELKLVIPRDELYEERVRKSVSIINELTERYRNHSSDDLIIDQDFLSMAAVHIAMLYLNEMGNKDASPAFDVIKELNEQLERYLNKKE